MASDECVFYYYDAGYSCRLKREKEGRSAIDSDIVHKYCWGYRYSECPLYKSNDSTGSGCFLTSACVEAKGLPDDCHELMILRSFRDGYLKAQPCGACEIAEYYQIAPQIVDKIKSKANSTEIFEGIYQQLVAPCVALIEKNENAKAHELYRQFVNDLKKLYIAEAENGY